MASETKVPGVVLFVGSNPSNASTCDAAFHGSTKSSQILTGWCKDLPGMKMHINVLDKKTENNRPLKIGEIKSNLEDLKDKIGWLKPDAIIALGKTATKALELINVNFYEMPHPSGRNRLLNDPNYVAEKVKGLNDYVTQALTKNKNETTVMPSSQQSQELLEERQALLQ